MISDPEAVLEAVITAVALQDIESALAYFDPAAELIVLMPSQTILKGHEPIHSILLQILAAFEVLRFRREPCCRQTKDCVRRSTLRCAIARVERPSMAPSAWSPHSPPARSYVGGSIKMPTASKPLCVWSHAENSRRDAHGAPLANSGAPCSPTYIGAYTLPDRSAPNGRFVCKTDGISYCLPL